MSLVARHVNSAAVYGLVLGGLFAMGATEAIAETPADASGWYNMTPGWYRPHTEESQPDIFFNHYVPGNGGNPAAAYPTPHPTPARVGHTYFTYQPFMPSEWMYQHHRHYYQHYNSGMGLNRTMVHWYAPPLHTLVHGLHKHFKLAR